MMHIGSSGIVVNLLVLQLVLVPAGHAQRPSGAAVRVAVMPALETLIADEDTDGDHSITIDDPHFPGSARGDRRFQLRGANGRLFEVTGTYYLSNLLAVLTMAREDGRDSIDLVEHDLFETPVQHISRAIRERYWQSLTRSVDEKGLAHALVDQKSSSSDGLNYLYVPHDDPLSQRYYKDVARRHPEWNMQVVTLPESVTGEYVRELDGRHGILSLALRKDSSGSPEGIPYVVPGGRFNEMYGWDSYFIVLGLLSDGYVSLARCLVDNMVYEIRHYGKILNANRTYYLTRSQPPFLTSSARAVYDRLPRNLASRRWLRGVLVAAIREYEDVWVGHDRMTQTGLSRYLDAGIGPPPEVEAGRFDSIFAQAARDHNMEPVAFREAYRTGRVRSAWLDEFFRHDRAMRESGHDASARLLGTCADLVTVDLNALLFKTESDIALLISREFGGSLSVSGVVQSARDWERRAERRRNLMTNYLWNEGRGMFFDYNLITHTQTGFESATTFYPLWAGLATERQASLVVSHAVPILAMPGGIAGSTERSRGPTAAVRAQTQWDYPFGWAPHQILVWSGLKNYHYDRLASELAYRWLYMMTWNACSYNGMITEKYDVVGRSGRVLAEYGNVGMQFSYVAREGFAWTNASYEIGRSILARRQLEDLDRLIPPEWSSHRLGR